MLYAHPEASASPSEPAYSPELEPASESADAGEAAPESEPISTELRPASEVAEPEIPDPDPEFDVEAEGTTVPSQDDWAAETSPTPDVTLDKQTPAPTVTSPTIPQELPGEVKVGHRAAFAFANPFGRFEYSFH